MKKEILNLTAVLLAGYAFNSSLNADDNLERRIDRFWDIAEQKVAAKPIESNSDEVEVNYYHDKNHVNPFHKRSDVLLPNNSQNVVVIEKKSNIPKVRVHQSKTKENKEKHFGLKLLGAIEIFDIEWGSRKSEKSDSLDADL